MKFFGRKQCTKKIQATMDKFLYIKDRSEAQWGFQLNDGRIISLFDENNQFHLRFDDVIDLETGVMQCANAGHEYPAVKRAGKSYELIKDKHSFVLGGNEGMKYSQYELVMQPGDKLFVYTDGVAEANNTSKELFGTDRMISALNANANATPEHTLKNMKQYIDDFCGEAEQFDDITMLCFEFIRKTEK